MLDGQLLGNQNGVKFRCFGTSKWSDICFLGCPKQSEMSDQNAVKCQSLNLEYLFS